jgi:hypothetical protein
MIDRFSILYVLNESNCCAVCGVFCCSLFLFFLLLFWWFTPLFSLSLCVYFLSLLVFVVLTFRKCVSVRTYSSSISELFNSIYTVTTLIVFIVMHWVIQIILSLPGLLMFLKNKNNKVSKRSNKGTSFMHITQQ